MSKSPQEPNSRQARRSLGRTFLALLAIGLALGGVTAAGVVALMNHLNLIGVPEQAE